MLKIILASLCFVSMAHADTIFVDAVGSKITASDAAKAKTPVFKCEKVKFGKNGSPIKVPGSETQWSSAPGAAIEEPGAALADGKKLFRCKSMLLDKTTARMKTADLGEAE